MAQSPTWAHPVVMNEGVLVKDVETLALWRWDGGTQAAGAMAPRAIRSSRPSPSTSSMTRKLVVSEDSSEYRVTMFG